MEPFDLPDDLAELERELAGRCRQEPSVGFRSRVAAAVTRELTWLGRRRWQVVMVGGMAAAIVVAAFTLWSVLRQPLAVQPTGIDSPLAAIPPPAKGIARSPAEARVPSLAQSVAESPVIVVATMLDSSPSPPMVPGDLPEVLIRFKIRRVLKGGLSDKVITTRHSIAPHQFMGKDWVIFLSPKYLAGGVYQSSHCTRADTEVLAILLREGIDPTWRAYRQAMAGSPEALEELSEWKSADNAPRSTPAAAFMSANSKFLSLNGDL